MLPMHQISGDPFGLHELFFSLLSVGSATLLWIGAASFSIKSKIKSLFKKKD